MREEFSEIFHRECPIKYKYTSNSERLSLKCFLFLRHLFSVASSCYTRLQKSGQPQVLVISGESGSGKTECTKLILGYLALVNKSPSNLITEQILESNPLLESFGNAKTLKNDNSSRFGKYIQIYFEMGYVQRLSQSV